MTNTSRQYTLATSHGPIAVEETGHGDLPTLLIHGNSSCRDVFRHQMNGRLAQNRRLISFDLPGHGQSSDARHPSRSYTRSGCADAAIEILGMLGLWMSWCLAGRSAATSPLRWLPGLPG